MELKRKMKTDEKHLAGLVAHKFMGQLGIRQCGYVGGICGTMLSDSWCCINLS